MTYITYALLSYKSEASESHITAVSSHQYKISRSYSYSYIQYFFSDLLLIIQSDLQFI